MATGRRWQRPPRSAFRSGSGLCRPGRSWAKFLGVDLRVAHPPTQGEVRRDATTFPDHRSVVASRGGLWEKPMELLVTIGLVQQIPFYIVYRVATLYTPVLCN